MSTGGVGWVLLLFRELLSGIRALLGGVDFDRTKKRGRYRETGSTNKRNTTQGEERRGEAWASPKSGVLRVLDEKIGVVTSTSIRA